MNFVSEINECWTIIAVIVTPFYFTKDTKSKRAFFSFLLISLPKCLIDVIDNWWWLIDASLSSDFYRSIVARTKHLRNIVKQFFLFFLTIDKPLHKKSARNSDWQQSGRAPKKNGRKEDLREPNRTPSPCWKCAGLNQHSHFPRQQGSRNSSYLLF